MMTRNLIILLFFAVSIVASAQVFSGVRLAGSTADTSSESDSFTSATLGSQWVFDRGVNGNYTLNSGLGVVQIQGGTATADGCGLGKTITGASWTIDTTFDFNPTVDGQVAGIKIGVGVAFATLVRTRSATQK